VANDARFPHPGELDFQAIVLVATVLGDPMAKKVDLALVENVPELTRCPIPRQFW